MSADANANVTKRRPSLFAQMSMKMHLTSNNDTDKTNRVLSARVEYDEVYDEVIGSEGKSLDETTVVTVDKHGTKRLSSKHEIKDRLEKLQAECRAFNQINKASSHPNAAVLGLGNSTNWTDDDKESVSTSANGEGIDYIRTHGNSQATLPDMTEMGALYTALNKPDQAELCFQQAVSHAPVDSIEYFLAMSNLAKSQKAQGHFASAIETYNNLLMSQRKVLGNNDMETLGTCSDLASLYRFTGHFDLAEPLLNECVTTASALFGDYHPNAIISRNNLANLCCDQKKYSEAEELYSTCVTLSREALGESHPTTLQYMSNMGLLYVETKRGKEAQVVFDNCINIATAAYGRDHVIVMRLKEQRRELSSACAIS